MSLATRCTACGTVFRVVQDQLKVSEGWVRCGRCNEVFNAFEGLFDLERDAPADWTPGAPAGPVPVEAIQPSSQLSVAETKEENNHLLADKVDAQLQTKQGSTPAKRVKERDRLDFPDARFEPEAAEEDDDPLPAIDIKAPAPAPARPPPPPPAPAAPQFMRRAAQRERWRSPAASFGLGLALLVLTLGLTLQAAHHFRDYVVVRWPAARPVMLSWCETLHCQIAPLARIDSVAVESTALTRDTAPDAFRLSVTLRNHGALPVATPSIDLTLTDPTGNLVARRVLGPQPSPRDAAGNDGTIAPGGESALQWVLSAGSARVTGYTVEIFYP